MRNQQSSSPVSPALLHEAERQALARKHIERAYLTSVHPTPQNQTCFSVGFAPRGLQAERGPNGESREVPFFSLLVRIHGPADLRPIWGGFRMPNDPNA